MGVARGSQGSGWGGTHPPAAVLSLEVVVKSIYKTQNVITVIHVCVCMCGFANCSKKRAENARDF